jgi:hypothetical protein
MSLGPVAYLKLDDPDKSEGAPAQDSPRSSPCRRRCATTTPACWSGARRSRHQTPTQLRAAPSDDDTEGTYSLSCLSASAALIA